MNLREIKGRDIAAKARIRREGDRWFVPSKSTRGDSFYVVKPDFSNPHCSCEDHQTNGAKCKHIWAVEFRLHEEIFGVDEQQPAIDPATISRPTYKQEWSAYNAAQTNEKDQFQFLLSELCKGIGEPSQTKGRPRLPLDEMIFATTFKVYSTVSQRRFMSDLRDAHAKGFISKVPHFNSISNYLENPALTPYLKMLIEESSLPLQTIESDFAVDSSGFSVCRFYQWVAAKYTEPKQMTKRNWIKVHLMCGVKTNIVTAVEITDRFAADVKYFEPLVNATAQNFVMQEVSADKAYLSAANLKAVVDNHAMPYIPFKRNSVPKWTAGLKTWEAQDRRARVKHQSELWYQMYHYFCFNQKWFLQQYHKRSNVETTFSMIKAKFGDSLRSKTETAQVNEALCKILAHNICCLIQSMYELNIKPEFWEAA
jgi:DDE family transposase